MQKYLQSQKINLKKKKILFKARTRMLNVKNNFGDKGLCPLCKLNEDDQSHLLDCIIIKMKCSDILENKEKCSYKDIYSNNIEKLSNISHLIYQAWSRFYVLCFQNKNPKISIKKSQKDLKIVLNRLK
jgi:hypothetical protein